MPRLQRRLESMLLEPLSVPLQEEVTVSEDICHYGDPGCYHARWSSVLVVKEKDSGRVRKTDTITVSGLQKLKIC
jgi:hypothetical protein